MPSTGMFQANRRDQAATAVSEDRRHDDDIRRDAGRHADFQPRTSGGRSLVAFRAFGELKCDGRTGLLQQFKSYATIYSDVSELGCLREVRLIGDTSRAIDVFADVFADDDLIRVR